MKQRLTKRSNSTYDEKEILSYVECRQVKDSIWVQRHEVVCIK